MSEKNAFSLVIIDIESEERGIMKALRPQSLQATQTVRVPVRVLETGTESCSGDREGVLVRLECKPSERNAKSA